MFTTLDAAVGLTSLLAFVVWILVIRESNIRWRTKVKAAAIGIELRECFVWGPPSPEGPSVIMRMRDSERGVVKAIIEKLEEGELPA